MRQKVIDRFSAAVLYDRLNTLDFLVIFPFIDRIGKNLSEGIFDQAGFCFISSNNINCLEDL